MDIKPQIKKTGVPLSIETVSKNGQVQNILNSNALERKSLIVGRGEGRVVQ